MVVPQEERIETGCNTEGQDNEMRMGEYFYSGDEADNAASDVMKELETLAVVNPPGTNVLQAVK